MKKLNKKILIQVSIFLLINILQIEMLISTEYEDISSSLSLYRLPDDSEGIIHLQYRIKFYNINDSLLNQVDCDTYYNNKQMKFEVSNLLTMNTDSTTNILIDKDNRKLYIQRINKRFSPYQYNNLMISDSLFKHLKLIDRKTRGKLKELTYDIYSDTTLTNKLYRIKYEIDSKNYIKKFSMETEKSIKGIKRHEYEFTNHQLLQLADLDTNSIEYNLFNKGDNLSRVLGFYKDLEIINKIGDTK